MLSALADLCLWLSQWRFPHHSLIRVSNVQQSVNDLSKAFLSLRGQYIVDKGSVKDAINVVMSLHRN